MCLTKTNLNNFSFLQPVTDFLRLGEELKECRPQGAVVITSYSAQALKPLRYCLIPLKKIAYLISVKESAYRPYR